MASEKNSLSIFQLLSGLYHTLRSLIADFAELAALELRLASKSLFTILLLAVFAVFLLVSAWLCFLALLVALICLFLKLPWALFIVFMLNTLLILFIGLIVLRLKSNLAFPATRRQFRALKEHYAKANDERVAEKNSAA